MAALAGPVGKAVEVSASLLGGARGRRAPRLPRGAGAGSRFRALGAAASIAAAFSVRDSGGRAGERKASALLCALRCRGGRPSRGRRRTRVSRRFEEGIPGGAPLGSGRREG